jgi:hypothetical protein
MPAVPPSRAAGESGGRDEPPKVLGHEVAPAAPEPAEEVRAAGTYRPLFLSP